MISICCAHLKEGLVIHLLDYESISPAYSYSEDDSPISERYFTKRGC